MRRVSTVMACGLALAVAGCRFGSSHPKEPADVFLKETLAAYASKPTYAVDCVWTATDGKDSFAAVRQIEYGSPNKYHVKAVHDNTLLLASVSDGAQVTEYSNVPGMLAGIYPAPANLALADSPQMKNPLDCGSPLYAFFAGVDGYSKLAAASSTPRYGADVDVAGVPCVTVDFTEPGGYGPVTAVIGVDDKKVRRISYDAASMVASGATVETESAPSSGAPPFKKTLPMKPSTLRVTEVYQDAPDAKLADSEWDTTLPQALPPFQLAQNTTSTTPAGGGGGNLSDAMADMGKPPVPIGSPAPDITVTDAKTGNKVKLSSFRGQTVMLDFFASWCMPCRMSLPETQKIYKTYGGHGMTVMGIDGESRSQIRSFLDSEKYTFPAYADTDSSASQAYKANAIPTVAIIDKQGRLSFYAVGLQEKGAVDAAVKKAGV